MERDHGAARFSAANREAGLFKFIEILRNISAASEAEAWRDRLTLIVGSVTTRKLNKLELSFEIGRNCTNLLWLCFTGDVAFAVG